LLDNILNISRIEDGLKDEAWESARVREQVDTAVDVVRNWAEQKGLWLKVNFADNVPERARLQTLKFQQILINLLTNAVKFTSKGGVTVDVMLSREAELVIRVTDTGIGVRNSNINHVFTPYWREAASGEGSGIGLSLSRDLARSVGGELKLLTADNEKGCVFELRVPLVV
jgi:signal transduction histidine kinase